MMAAFTVFLFIKQSTYDISRYGIVLSKDAEAAEQSALGQDFFTGITPSGFSLFRADEHYGRDTLYEKINGKAPLYLDAGFRHLHTQRYSPVNVTGTWIEIFIYDMGDGKNAFSVYSSQKRADAAGVTGISTAYKTGNGLFMVAGSYYVEILASEQSSALNAANHSLAQEIDAELSGKTEALTEKDIFEDPRLIAGSVVLYRQGAFGYDGFSDLYTAKYNVNDVRYTPYLSRLENSKAAKKLAGSYADFLVSTGGNKMKVPGADSDFIIIDFYGSIETIFTVGQFMAGVHEGEDLNTALSISRGLKEKLKKAQ